MGVTTPIPYDYTISLGSNSVKLFEMTRAYGVFANGGFKVEPYAIERIESSRGTVLYEARKTRTSRVLNINTAATMTAIMKTVIQSGTGRAANIGKPAAGKTGTTDDCKDAYFIGFTPDVVTGVWVGNDDNSKMGELTGGTVPAKIWRDVMLVATEPYGAVDFEYPEIILNPFKARSISVISQSEAKKAWEEEDAKEAEMLEKEAEKEAKRIEKEAKKIQKEIQEQLEKGNLKPDSIKSKEILQQTMTPIKKKETPKVIEVGENSQPIPPKEEIQENDLFAPVPLNN